MTIKAIGTNCSSYINKNSYKTVATKHVFEEYNIKCFFFFSFETKMKEIFNLSYKKTLPINNFSLSEFQHPSPRAGKYEFNGRNATGKGIVRFS